ncbi:lysophospholipid acyltransferase family protein [Litorimonas sp. RW-G-Af-16]|uniref:lysophospholipid acyltransferase family protein n=1 Tax=Litorimonas sp. RW-G-Af-16 TaxID=3241168 RepID=UPI00390C607A
MFKRFMRSTAVQMTIGWLVAAYMTVVKYTTRWDIERAEHAQPIIDGGKGFIALTWHSRFMMLTSAWKKGWQTPHVLISRSRDGEIVAHTSHFLGLKTIRGSAKKAAKDGMAAKAKGGKKAGLDIVSAIEAGGCIVVTPDGPRGPRQRLPDGSLRLAKLTGAPILPCTFAVKHRKQFDSWDKFVLPLPFGRGRIIWGTPQYVAADATDASMETLRQSIESEMNQFLADADMAMGHTPIAPDS